MQNDNLSDVLTRLRNGTKKGQVLIPLTRFNLNFCKILKEQGFIKQFRLVTESRFFIKVELVSLRGHLGKPVHIANIIEPNIQLNIKAFYKIV